MQIISMLTTIAIFGTYQHLPFPAEKRRCSLLQNQEACYLGRVGLLEQLLVQFLLACSDSDLDLSLSCLQINTQHWSLDTLSLIFPDILAIAADDISDRCDRRHYRLLYKWHLSCYTHYAPDMREGARTRTPGSIMITSVNEKVSDFFYHGHHTNCN